MWFYLLILKKFLWFLCNHCRYANTVDPDQKSHSVTSNKGLHCLPMFALNGMLCTRWLCAKCLFGKLLCRPRSKCSSDIGWLVDCLGLMAPWYSISVSMYNGAFSERRDKEKKCPNIPHSRRLQDQCSLRAVWSGFAFFADLSIPNKSNISQVKALVAQ